MTPVESASAIAADAGPPARPRLGIAGLTPTIIAVAAIWALLVVAVVILQRATGVGGATCLFRRITGFPCAACGSTRAALSLAAGQPLRALAFNPLMTALMLAAPVWLALRLLRPPRRMPRPLAGRVRALLWLLAVGVVAANWAYVIWHESR
jgi:hypothetical protein